MVVKAAMVSYRHVISSVLSRGDRSAEGDCAFFGMFGSLRKGKKARLAIDDDAVRFTRWNSITIAYLAGKLNNPLMQ